MPHARLVARVRARARSRERFGHRPEALAAEPRGVRPRRSAREPAARAPAAARARHATLASRPATRRSRAARSRPGCGFFAGYPITPVVRGHGDADRGAAASAAARVVQAEDEIAALGMVLGASFGGVPAMTATSGPGLSLMTEMLGLSSMAELPAVIVDCQRAGPATGMPSRTEQSRPVPRRLRRPRRLPARGARASSTSCTRAT